MTGNGHVRFGRGPSGKGPAQLAPRPTAYLTEPRERIARSGRPRLELSAWSQRQSALSAA